MDRRVCRARLGGVRRVLRNASDPQTLEYIIPKGTATQLLLGEPINIMPDRIDLSVGDRLIIRNRDVVNHTVGPYTMRPGESIDVTYHRVGRFTGICTVNANSDTVITIR
ncbi:MAG: hypothetical protein IPG46_19675 [Actinobacteria bacterium]|nr:hypothetical protein [Actinomycetota bacterium]